VGEVVLGDLTMALVVDDGGAVGGEPLVGGDDQVGFGVVGVACGEQGIGLRGGGAGARRGGRARRRGRRRAGAGGPRAD
jgi:hypothetical protein